MFKTFFFQVSLILILSLGNCLYTNAETTGGGAADAEGSNTASARGTGAASAGTSKASAAGTDTASAEETGTVVKCGQRAFHQYQTKDKLGRTITFYLTEPAGSSTVVPLVVHICGSGGGSLFGKDGQGHVYDTGDFEVLLTPMKDRARLLVVEKCGVKLFEEPPQHGISEGCSEEFLREHTLDRTTEAHNAAIEAARTLPGIDKNKLLVIGYSEGGQVCTHVAATNPHVTHVASLVGGGPTQLFDMIVFAENNSREPTKAAEEVIAAWKDIVANKDSYTKFWSGHTYRRWYSFCTSSPLQDLLNCSAKAYIVQGTKDISTLPVAFDVMRAELLAHNRPFVAEQIEGANHHLEIVRGKNKVVSEKRPEVMARIINWFLAD